MTDNLHFLQHRNSSPRLVEPAPSAAALEGIFQAALRAPDHKHLVPFRFAVVSPEQRPALAALFEAASLRAGHDADTARKDGERAWNLRFELAERWPNTAVSSLGAGNQSERAWRFRWEVLRKDPENLLLVKHVVKAAVRAAEEEDERAVRLE